MSIINDANGQPILDAINSPLDDGLGGGSPTGVSVPGFNLSPSVQFFGGTVGGSSSPTIHADSTLITADNGLATADGFAGFAPGFTADRTTITADSGLATADGYINLVVPSGITADRTNVTADSDLVTADGHLGTLGLTADHTSPTADSIAYTADGGLINAPLDVSVAGFTILPAITFDAGFASGSVVAPFEFGEINRIDYNQIAINGNSYGPEYDTGRTIIKTTWDDIPPEFGLLWAFQGDTIEFDIIISPEPRKMVMTRKGLQTIVELR